MSNKLRSFLCCCEVLCKGVVDLSNCLRHGTHEKEKDLTDPSGYAVPVILSRLHSIFGSVYTMGT